MIYLHENGVTVVATSEAKRGKVYELNGEKYYVARGVSDIKRIVDSGEYPLNRVITSKLTSLNYLFQIRGGYGQAAVPANFNDDISNWDTSNILSMEEVFSGWTEFNQDISNWDTSRVESMYGMFKSSKYVGNYYLGDTSFNKDISNWDVSNVKNMSEMFLGATSFNKDISNWVVSNVENMDHMFSGATSFNQPIGNWDVSKVENMSGMFSDVNSIGVLAFVGTLEFTRAGSTSFNQDISNWDISNVENMGHMFSGATSFNKDISNWDVSNVKNMANMFSGGRKDAALIQNAENNSTSFNQDISNWDLSNVENMDYMFSGATSFNQDLNGWNVSNVESMGGMFSGAVSFNQPIGNWNVSKVGSMNHMFSGATSFNQDLNGWNVSTLSGVENMFSGATSFNKDISNWDVSNVKNMSEMFLGATSFNKDISSWDVSNVTQMKGLFQDATSFNQNIRKWKLNEELPKSRTMFKNAQAFNIKEYNPFLNKIAKERNVDTSTANLSPDDKRTFSKIKKLLTERDYDKIDLGLELLISLNNSELFETLLFDCKINTNDYDDKSSYNVPDYGLELIRNKLFTGSEPAQPFLDYALINVIANAPNDAKIDNSLQVNKMSSFDIKLLKCENMNNSLPLEKFTSLKTLTFDFNLFNIKGAHYGSKGGFNYNEGDNGVNIEDFFIENNITHLKAKNVKGSFKWMKNFKQLKSLEFDTSSGYNIEDIESYKYLENLEELKFSSSNFLNLDFLTECKNLKKLDLSVSYSISSYSDDKKLENIHFLSKLNSLEDLKLRGLSEYEFENFDFSGLYSCKQIKKLSIDFSKSTDLSELKNCISLESLELIANHSGKMLDVSANISEINGLKELKSLKSISAGTLSFYGLENGNLMKDPNSTKIIEKSTRVNEKDIALVENVLNPNPEKSKSDYVANNTERTKLTSDDRKSFSEIKKLLSTRDFDKIDDGVQKLVSLNILELFETLLDGCEITVKKNNIGFYKHLMKNKIFTGSSPAQPYLNYALFSIIANTPDEAEINDTIIKRNLIDLDMSVFDISALRDRFIPIEKLTSLSSLTLDFEIFEGNYKDAKNINREHWFANNNISKLDVKVSGSLQWMKNFIHLKYLNFEFGYYPVNHIEGFEFLENIEELSLKNFNYEQVFKNLDFLKKSKKIKKFSLEIKNSYRATEKLENIDIIKNFTELTDIEITGIYTGLSLDFLLSCKKIKNLTLQMDNSKNDINYFELLKNCSSLETLNINGLDSYNIKGKVLDINGLNGLPNLKNFSLNNVNISTSDNSIFIN